MVATYCNNILEVILNVTETLEWWIFTYILIVTVSVLLEDNIAEL